MGKVKDTASFIERASELHGDKYDYSQTIYAGAHRPIVIICRTCGPIQLKHAGSHYKKRKNCGCKKCNLESALVNLGRAKWCKACGIRIKYNGCNVLCRDCIESLSDEWASALTSAESRLLGRHKDRIVDGWDKWAKVKQSMITQRKYKIPNLKLKARIGTWDAWSLKATKKLRKGETPWETKCKRWQVNLSRRETRPDGENLES